MTAGVSTTYILSMPMQPMGIEDGDTFAVVLEEDTFASEVSPEAETEIGRSILIEIQKRKPAVRFLPSDKFRLIALSELNINKLPPCAYMQDWFSPINTGERTQTTDTDQTNYPKEDKRKTLTPEALSLQKQTSHVGLRYVICVSKLKSGGGKGGVDGGDGFFAAGYTGHKSIQLMAWIFDVKNGNESGYCNINVRDESVYGVVGGGGGMGVIILPIIWPAFYHDSKACRVLGEEIAKLILETPIISEQEK